MAFLLVAGSPVGPTVEAVSPTTCPSQAAVQKELAALLRSRGPARGQADGDAGEVAPPHRVRLEESGGGVRVALLGQDGTALAVRDLPPAQACADLAVAAAVIIATWESDMNALDGPLAVGSLGPEASAANDASAAPALPTVSATPAASAGPSTSATFAVGGGLLSSITGGTVAPGARLEARLSAAGRRLGLAIALSVAGTHAASVADRNDAVAWWRATLAAGPEYRFGRVPWTFDVHVWALGAALNVSGVGLPRTRTEIASQFGMGTGARAGWSWGTVMTWLGADALVFPGRDTLAIDGLTATGTLPHTELQIALGFSWGRFP